jgi:hypothetical protein
MNTCQQNALDEENKNLLSYEKEKIELDEKKTLITAIVAFFFSLLAGVQIVKLAEANFMPMQIPQPAFIIKSDGSIYFSNCTDCARWKHLLFFG